MLPAFNVPASNVLGLDIGGANLKAASADGHSLSVPFAIWLHADTLAQRLVTLATDLPACQRWAVTMTGELADNFFDRGIGVQTLVDQTRQAAGQLGVTDLAFYSVEGRFIGAAEAIAQPDAVASANWHALANWLASQIDSPSLLIDIGGTTTDIIAIRPGQVATKSRTDFDRLLAAELVYLGGTRTPVCSLVQSLPFDLCQLPVMREVFATTDDCALVLALTGEDPQDHTTSDGGPRTVAAAVNRLARMIGLDHRRVDLDAARLMARAVIDAASDILAAALRRHASDDAGHWILSGHTAEYFLPALFAAFPQSPPITRLADQIGPQLSRVAPAYACARLRQ
jgi:(4-(4-[2-(gamma-L-glutamylamino)ethyl]phenoxymethyl)furan-2-yl)methanamine synthase